MRRKSRQLAAGEVFLTRSALAQVTRLDRRSPVSLVDRLFGLVCDAVRDGRLAMGARLPSVRQLAHDCEISRDTAVRAYDKLVAHGVLESRRGSGYYVKSVATSPDFNTPPPAPLARSSKTTWSSLSSLHNLRFNMVQDTSSFVSRSGVGTLPADWIDEEHIGKVMRSVAKGSHRSLAHHGDPQGYPPLREQLRLKLREIGVYTEASNIIVTSGATDALHLIALYYLHRPDEPVLVEQPCQPLLIDRLMACGLAVETVPRLSDGPDLDVLQRLCERLRPQLFFCNSVLHNPTSSHLAPHKAFQLLRLAEEFNLTIVEDDSYGDLLPSTLSTAAARLAPLDQLNRVIYVGSFSKTLGAGLRVGYLAASTERIEWLSVYRLLSNIASNSFAERTVHRLLADGDYRHHCEQLRARLALVRPKAATQAQRAGLHLDAVPDAGMFLWADLGPNIDSVAVALSLLAEGHLVSPGPVFHDHKSSRVRLNITTSLDTGALDAIARAVRWTAGTTPTRKW